MAEIGQRNVERVLREREVGRGPLPPGNVLHGSSVRVRSSAFYQFGRDIQSRYAPAASSRGDGDVPGSAADVEDVVAGGNGSALDEAATHREVVRGDSRVRSGCPHPFYPPIERRFVFGMPLTDCIAGVRLLDRITVRLVGIELGHSACLRLAVTVSALEALAPI